MTKDQLRHIMVRELGCARFGRLCTICARLLGKVRAITVDNSRLLLTVGDNSRLRDKWLAINKYSEMEKLARGNALERERESVSYTCKVNTVRSMLNEQT